MVFVFQAFFRSPCLGERRHESEKTFGNDSRDTYTLKRIGLLAEHFESIPREYAFDKIKNIFVGQ